MRKWLSALCAGCLLLAIPLAMQARRALPRDNRALIAEKYAGWSGVLRLWVCESWECGSGSISGWLKTCLAGFERRHPGVYVQPQIVDAATLAGFRDSDAPLPDLLLFAPGTLDSPAGLLPVSRPDALRPALAHAGAWGEDDYAVPVAMGGYLWVYNAAMIDGIPGSWREADISPAVPESQSARRWDAALLALCARRWSPASDGGGEDRTPDLDLGLGAAAEPTLAPSPEAASLPCQLPEDFRFRSDAWRAFVGGEAAAMLVTQRELRRLEALSERGRGPDWRAAVSGTAFSDQLLCLAVVDKPGAQQALGQALIDALLDESCQSALWRWGAFGVTDAASGYPARDPLAPLDAALHDADAASPGCFDGSWPEAAGSIVRKLIENEAEAPALWRQFAERLRQNPNNRGAPAGNHRHYVPYI